MQAFRYQIGELFNPLLTAFKNLGGSASIEEQENEVAKILNLSEYEINEIHKGNRTKLSYRLAWARTYLKAYCLLDNSERGVWNLTTGGKVTNQVDPKLVIENLKRKTINLEVEVIDHDEEKEILAGNKWQDKTIEIIQTIPPASFERLCQRLLRELGFINVIVTGKSGDGGIDGKGIWKIGGVLSFNVYFQSKRLQGSIAPSIVRDFRGALQGRADKGLIASDLR